MLESASNVIQASLNTSSGEIKAVPKDAPKQEPVSPPEPAQAPAQEPEKAAAAAPPVAEVPKPDPLSKGFQAMARKDKELRARQVQIRQMEAQIQEREAQIARFEQLKHQNPVEAIKALGLSYEDLTNFQLAGGQLPTAELEIKNIKEQMAAYVERQEAEKADLRAQQQAQAAAQVQETLNEFKGQVAEYIKSKPDDYEMITIEGPEALDLVYSTVEAHFNRTKQVLPMEDAAKLVEQYLTEDAENKFKQAKKFQKMMAPAPTPPAEPGFSAASRSAAMDRAANVLSGPRPSLNNTMTASTAPSLVAPRLENDRMARAAAALDRKR